MKQLTRSCSYSWWGDSRNCPTQSAWLHNTLGEVEEKTQSMLSLVEAEADSFAEQAEFFYHKRPQLISMIEEYYRAYRSLAEQYAHLKGQIRQNVRESVQVKYALSCEAPLESPFRNQISGTMNPPQGFKEFLRRQERYGSDSEAEGPESENCNRIRKRHSDQESISMPPSDQESASALSDTDSVVASHVVDPTETENVGGMLREMEENNSLLRKQLIEKNIQVKQLENENNKLKEEKAFWKEEMSLVVEDRSLLQEELEIIKAENTKLRNESEVNVWERNDLHKELNFITDQNTKLRDENEINVQQLKVLRKKISNLQKGNKRSKNTNLSDEIEANQQLQVLKEYVCNFQEENSKLCTQKDVEIRLEKNEKLLMKLSLRLGELQNEVHQLLDENRILEIELVERDEHKREAIRQLCFTLDKWMNKNKRLHKVLQKLQGEGGSKLNNIGISTSEISWWKKFLNAGWWM